jgi:hypothetical protein
VLEEEAMQFDDMLVHLKQCHERFAKLGDVPGPRFDVHRKEQVRHTKKDEHTTLKEAA